MFQQEHFNPPPTRPTTSSATSPRRQADHLRQLSRDPPGRLSAPRHASAYDVPATSSGVEPACYTCHTVSDRGNAVAAPAGWDTVQDTSLPRRSVRELPWPGPRPRQARRTRPSLRAIRRWRGSACHRLRVVARSTRASIAQRELRQLPQPEQRSGRSRLRGVGGVGPRACGNRGGRGACRRQRRRACRATRRKGILAAWGVTELRRAGPDRQRQLPGPDLRGVSRSARLGQGSNHGPAARTPAPVPDQRAGRQPAALHEVPPAAVGAGPGKLAGAALRPGPDAARRRRLPAGRFPA